MAMVELVDEDDDLADAELWAAIDSAAALSTRFPPKPLLLTHFSEALKPPVLTELPPSPQPASSALKSDLARTPKGQQIQSRNMYRFPLKDLESHESAMIPQELRDRCLMGGSLSGGKDRGCAGNIAASAWMAGLPSPSVFKQIQEAAMGVLEKSDYVVMSGKPFIKKSGWRKIAFFFNISFEIKDKQIQFDQSANVLRAEFIVRASMQGGRFSDGWGSCDLREKKFSKPNHDIPSTAETRAKTRACQDLLGIGEYKFGCGDHGW
ncbi:hypothetical protein O6H91_20G035300 [Diphasiastrum complanatum]|uniref:Uncharacterized protein n=1 Tax=Diphasiastrum complanatum TaxID=34168 RepID=A0ACC2AP77_DIPCM|nr:hypothetical protein O6H91_20G035300 [Diphasiastrum complanatum]